VELISNGLKWAALVQVLEKVFMSAVLLLSVFWDAQTKESRERQDPFKQAPMTGAETAVRLLDILASLQLCRMRISAYSLLLQGLLTSTAADPQVHSHW